MESSTSDEVREDCVLFLLLKADPKQPSLERSAEMDPNVWSQLPDNLLEEVVRRLQTPSHFRFRAVSKAWAALLSSPEFLRRTTAGCHPPRSLSICGSIVSLSKDVVRPGNVRKLRLPYSPNLYPCCTGGGLICFRSTSSSFQLHVCNPLIRTWRQLPEYETPYHCVTRTTLVYNRDLKTYKIQVTCRKEGAHENDWAICIYDSSQDSWKTVPLQPCRGMEFAHVFCNGMIYCIDSQLMLWSHDITEGVWRQLSVQRPANVFERHISLEEHCGSLLLVGFLSNSLTSYAIWKLEESQGAWIEVAVLHKEQMMDLFVPSAEREQYWNSISLGDCFFLHIWISLPRSRSKGMLVFNFEQSLWLAWAIDFGEKSTSLRFFYPCDPRLDQVP